MSHSQYEKTLQEWAKKWRQDNLTPEVIRLISQANYDLWHGPINDGSYGDPAEGDEELKKYPGFAKAVDQIEDALKDLPSDLYLDTDSGEVSTKEPEGERCEDCQGEGSITENHPAVETSRAVKCSACNGVGAFEPAGDWWHVDGMEIRKALFGKELAQYIRK